MISKLIILVAQGNREAFNELYRLMSPRVFLRANRMVKDSEIAKDIVQEVFLAVWRKADTFIPLASGEFWILIITRNISLNYVRDRKKEQKGIELLMQNTLRTYSNFDIDESEYLLNCLDKKERDIIILKASGYTYKEIAKLYRLKGYQITRILRRVIKKYQLAGSNSAIGE